MSADVSGLRSALQGWAARVVDDSRTEAAGRIRAREWLHDHPPEPFDPHVQLHGTAFEDDDDEQLANPESWPRTPHYHPGDHRGCRCGTPPLPIVPIGGVTGGAAPVGRIGARLRPGKQVVVVTRRRSSTVRVRARQGGPRWWEAAVRREWSRALPAAARRNRL